MTTTTRNKIIHTKWEGQSSIPTINMLGNYWPAEWLSEFQENSVPWRYLFNCTNSCMSLYGVKSVLQHYIWNHFIVHRHTIVDDEEGRCTVIYVTSFSTPNGRRTDEISVLRTPTRTRCHEWVTPIRRGVWNARTVSRGQPLKQPLIDGCDRITKSCGCGHGNRVAIMRIKMLSDFDNASIHHATLDLDTISF